jgi:2,3-bisphosphoglycerate-independent phosphoglycerate mutase
MKYAMVILAGAADEPIDRLDGRTPLEAAEKPHIDRLSMDGRQGRVATIPGGFAPGGDVALMSLLGYDPAVHHEGRAPFEALAQGIQVEPDEWLFCCDFVTIIEGRMEDATAGHISPPEVDRLIVGLNTHVADEDVRFHAGTSQRNLTVVSSPTELTCACTPPCDIPAQPVERHLPRGPGSDRIKALMERAHDLLAGHDVNMVRRDLGDNPATDIWLWGQGRVRRLPAFGELFGVTAAMVTDAVFARGLALGAGIEAVDAAVVGGSRGGDETAMGRAAVELLEAFDLVVVHVSTPEAAASSGDLEQKLAGIRRIDEQIVGVLLEAIQKHEAWRLLIAADVVAPVERRTHTSAAVPFCMAGRAVHTVLNHPLCESAAARSDLCVDPGHDLMEYFLRL